MIEPRAEIARDRTFAYFRGEPHPFEAAVTHAWSRIAIRHGARALERELGRPYEHVAGDVFHAVGRAQLARAEHVTLHLGASATRVEERDDRVRVETTLGTIEADVVFDARGTLASEASARDVRWLQHFVGWRVRTERPVFDARIATLMDFALPPDPGPRFFYVLPYSSHEALVEDTVFSEAPLATETYERAITEHLDERGAGSFEIVGRERGAIPMTTAALPAPTDRIVPLGIAGGAAKPSTGYQFTFAQRHAAAIVRAMLEGAALSGVRVRSRRALFFDRVFLSYLARHRERAPEVFFDLWSRVPADALARFLSEHGGALDHARVIAAVPALPVLREALQSAPLWLR